MTRVIKNPDVRRLEIMQAAENLFAKEGYVKTSVESIIKEAGIAKGTFYYYFKAKEDILEALVEQVAEKLEAHLHSILNLPNLNAVEKLKLMIKGREKSNIVASPVMEIIHKPKNRELQEKLNIKGVKIFAPLLVKVLKEGKNEKLFNKVPSLEIVQLVLAGSQFVLESGLFSWSAKKQIAFLQSLQSLLELLVGVKAGTLNFIANEE